MIEIGNKIQGEIRFNRSGSAYLVSDNIAKDIYINKKNTSKAFHLDIVEIDVIKGVGRPLEGIVKKIIKRNKTTFVGTIQLFDNFAFVLPDNKKMHVDFFIPPKKILDANNGQKVLVEFDGWDKRRKNPNGKIKEIIGDSGENDVELHAILHEYGLSSEFSEEIIDEVTNIEFELTDSELSKRKDLRDILTFTIDPETAKDFDDALSIRVIDENIVEVGVHIADVTHYLRPGTDLDIEAYTRGTSIYLVDRTIPMLPERLCNDLCSLKPNEDKYTFSIIFKLNKDGKIIDQWIGKTITHSDKRFTYQEAQNIIEKELTRNSNKYDIAIKTLNNIAKKLRERRKINGSLNFNKREVSFVLDETKKPIGVKVKKSMDSNKLIEEFMLLANKKVAEYIKKSNFPCVNRAHESPDSLKLESISDYALKIGYEVNFSSPHKIRETLNHIVKTSEGKPEANVLSTLIVRSMQKAFYTTKDIGHYGLNFEDYSHFTSPIRRYSDVLTHRILYRLLNNKTSMKKDKLEARCQYISNMERRAKKAERDSIKFKQVEFMEDKIGELYQGVISGLLDSGVFVEIIDNQCEGFVKIQNISGDEYEVDLDNYKLIGKNNNDIISLGDTVHVIVESVNLDFKEINLKIIRT